MEPEDPRHVLRRLGIRPSRSRGQHFLADPRIALRQVSYAGVESSDIVLEIGPGLGILTRVLLERARRVVAIESDRRFAAYLQRTLPEVDLIQGDALRVEWPSFDRMVSNVPYQISSPLVFKLLEHPFERAVLMLQWEFAKRMIAKPGTADYSRLSVGVYTRATCEILERVPRSVFHPQPRVDSAIVRLEPRPPPFPSVDPTFYDLVVGALFRHRRKTVENGLRLACKSLGLSPGWLEARLPRLPFRGRRVGELRPEDIAEIAEALRGAKG